MKKLILLAASLVLCFSLVSCTDPKPNPEDLIDKGDNSFLEGPGQDTPITEIPFD